jgi:hypothetical protein
MVRLQLGLKHGSRCPWRTCAWVLATSGPIPFRPLLCGCPEQLSNPSMGQPSNSWALSDCKSIFSSTAYLPTMVVACQAVKLSSDVSFEGAIG